MSSLLLSRARAGRNVGKYPISFFEIEADAEVAHGSLDLVVECSLSRAVMFDGDCHEAKPRRGHIGNGAKIEPKAEAPKVLPRGMSQSADFWLERGIAEVVRNPGRFQDYIKQADRRDSKGFLLVVLQAGGLIGAFSPEFVPFLNQQRVADLDRIYRRLRDAQ